MVVGTRTGEAEVKVDASDLVFVGYGVDAPEQKWNDYAGQDWKGKTVVMFVNDPGFHVGDEKLFDGKRMTYYGRWTYKFEEAARKGAAAALIVHDTAGASYGWDVVKNSWAGPQYDLPAKDDPETRIPVQGWLSADAAKALFAGAGLDLAQAYKDASKRGFKPVPLKATAAVDLRSQIAPPSPRRSRATWSASCPAASGPTRPCCTWRTGITWASTRVSRATTSTTVPSTTRPAWPASWKSPTRWSTSSRHRSVRWCSWP